MTLKYKIVSLLLFVLIVKNCEAINVDYKYESKKLHQFNLGISADTHILNINVAKGINNENYFLLVQKSNVDFIDFTSNIGEKKFISGQGVQNKIEFKKDPYFIYPLSPGYEYKLRIKSNEQLILPISIADKEEINKIIFQRNLLSGIFIGLIGALFLYNLFLFFFLKDITYFYYIMFLLFIGIAQLDIIGFNYFIFKSIPNVYNKIMHLCSGISGIFGMLFFQKFMETKKTTPLGHKILSGVAAIYALVLIVVLLGFDLLSYQLVQLGGLSIPAALVIAIYLAFKGNNTGKYVIIGWSILIIGVILYALKDFGIIPFNMLTNYTLAFGVAIQAILLSVALASRINKLNSERDIANLRVLEEVRKNEELVRDQNLILEEKVVQRTQELQTALDELKATQSQLVQSEKMASLGVLTAGIAHEINNPINFVTANVVPLRENIETISNLLAEYKSIDFNNLESEMERMNELEGKAELEYTLKETSQLIDGIEEGAKRTHSIVDGLKSFSRGDAGSLNKANINKAIDSTLSVLKSRLNGVNLQKSLSDVPKISCQIGKLNQAFLNLINNAIDAVEEKNGPNSKNSKISITTYQLEDKLVFEIEDNGIGMDEETKQKVFEPFFTTKQIGKGTGLGLSISYGIIEEHHGEMTLESEIGVGTKFIITLPIS